MRLIRAAMGGQAARGGPAKCNSHNVDGGKKWSAQKNCKMLSNNIESALRDADHIWTGSHRKW